MSFSAQRFDRILSTIDIIINSPRVQHYCIGYTGRSIQARSDQYWSFAGGAEGWDHMVALADKLMMTDAIELEFDLQEEIKRNFDPRSRMYQKYERKGRSDVSRRSAGGRLDDGLPTHTVYIAWTSQRLVYDRP